MSRAPDVVETPSGPALIHWHGRARGADLAVFGHGAGGGVDAPDLVAVRDLLTELGWRVAMVEQPYRVKGRRAPEAAPRLDAAWSAVVAAIRGRSTRLVVGGRSSGARVACRTASPLQADGVIALAFPLHPPGKPEKSRLAELTGAGVPALVVQGVRDPFGGPDEFPVNLPPGISLCAVAGDHSLRSGREAVTGAVSEWITQVGALHPS